MTAPQDARALIGRTVVDPNGDKIGKVGQVYLNDQSGEPEWVTVSTGLFGNKESFVPLQGSSVSGDDLVTGVTKDVVKGAPNVDADGHTDDDDQRVLYDYYAGHLATGTNGTVTDTTDGVVSDGYATDRSVTDSSVTDSDGIVGRDTSGPTTDDAMTLSEERLRVGTEKVESGRVRLRKYVVTENVTQTVPVSHEEVRLEREPITDANIDSALGGPDISEEEHEVTLHAERPVVQTETVPVERVRLNTETVTENQTVTGEVRKEQVDSPDVDSLTK